MVTTGPLEGTRVVDLTRFVSGAYTTMLMGALGADVVKIETPPDGDPYRHQGNARIDGMPALFLALNSDKKSVALDFRDATARRCLDRLLASADFLVENSRTGSLEKYELDFAAVHARHPHIVYGSITGYGDVGPDARRGGFDLILQAESGIMSVTGSPESGPLKVGAPVLDVGAGLATLAGLLAAYVERLGTGVGTRVSSSLYHFALAGLNTVVAEHLASGEVPPLLGTHSPIFAPYGAFRARDGWLVLAGTGSEHLWGKLCEVLGRSDLTDDPRFRTNADRLRHRDELTEKIEAALQRDDADSWIARLGAADVPAGRVRQLPDILASPQAQALEMVAPLLTGDGPTYRAVAMPLRIDGKAVRPRAGARPLGADTRQVLREAGISSQDIDELVHAGLAMAPR